MVVPYEQDEQDEQDRDARAEDHEDDEDDEDDEEEQRIPIVKLRIFDIFIQARSRLLRFAENTTLI